MIITVDVFIIMDTLIYKATLFHIDCKSELVAVMLFGVKSFDAEFKFYPKTNNLSYWEHSVKSTNAKEDITNLIKLIESQTKELT